MTCRCLGVPAHDAFVVFLVAGGRRGSSREMSEASPVDVDTSVTANERTLTYVTDRHDCRVYAL